VQSTRSLGLGYKICAIIPIACQRTHGTTLRALKVTSQVATPGAESAVYDCLVRNIRLLIVPCSATNRSKYTTVIQGGPKKLHNKLVAIILSNLNPLSEFCHWKILWWICNKVNPATPCICCHTTLWNINKWLAINYKVYTNINIMATYLRCGGDVNNQIKKDLLLSLSVNFFKRWLFCKVTSTRKKMVVSCTSFVF